MKKLTLFTVSLAITFLANAAWADRAYVPMSMHYGSTQQDYTQLLITNLSSETVSVTATWLGTGYATGGDQWGSFNTLSTYTLANTNLGGGKTWHIDTANTNVLGTTTANVATQITVQSSGSDDPLTGPIGVWGFFVSTEGSQPSGFMFPTVRRTVGWNSVGLAGSDKQYRWQQ